MEWTEEALLDRANILARKCAAERVPENHLGTVVAHLKEHRNVRGTLALLNELPKSPFASRSGSTRKQLLILQQAVGAAFRNISDWYDAAYIAGWGRRLQSTYRQR